MDQKDLQFYDFLDYSSNLVVRNLDGNFSYLDLFDYQIEVALKFFEHKMLVTSSARQVGMTVLTLSLAHWYSNSFENKTVVYCTHSYNDAKSIKSVFTLLNPTKKYIKDNSSEVELHNGSKVLFRSFNTTSLFGHNINFLIVDNASWVQNGKSEWNNLQHNIDPIGYVWINSTPKSKDTWFYDMFTCNQTFYSITIPWNKNPNLTKDWYEKMKLFGNNYKNNLDAQFV